MSTNAKSMLAPAEVVNRSPLRCLLHSVRKSRRGWKAKAQKRNSELKVLKVRVRDMERSRKRHADKAEQAYADLRFANQEIERLRAELARSRNETRVADCDFEKKVRC